VFVGFLFYLWYTLEVAQERCLILIDGSNFFFKLKSLQLHNLLSFDFTSFNNFLCRDGSLSSATYFVGKVKTDGTEKTKKLQANQQKLLQHLAQHHYRYALGYLMKSDGVFHEKGVDVEIAVSILVAAYEDLADRIILVSSDTDLLPAIKKAQEKGKVVEYVGFSHQPSLALIAKCSKSRLLEKADLQPLVS
jgi:uncharacterized LabA/DUF88 family protein